MRARISPKRLIIAAAAARPFVRAAAAAGFEVVAVDAFCDADTSRNAVHATQADYVRGGFAAEDFRRKVFPLLAGEATAFLYGSGFETQPDFLEEIARLCPVLGNDVETVRITKSPGRFFSLLTSLDLPFPEYSLKAPRVSDGWLCKRVGGSGGTHVSADFSRADGEHYFQRSAPGRPYSLLFLADGRRIRPVGFNEQLLAPSPDMPFRYGGAVSQAVLPPGVCAGMQDSASRITAAIGLRGLNSLDCMVDGERFQVLEVNPRLSATFALYDAATEGRQLLQAHLQACQGELPPPLPTEQAQVHLIYYASHDLGIPVGMRWPEWVADIPPDTSIIRAGQPLCTVRAAHGTAVAARALARLRVTRLAQRINQLRNE